MEYSGKTLLITGGTGSFGNTVLRKYLKKNIKEIRIFSRDEKKQEEIRLTYRDERLKFIIGNVRDYDSVSRACIGVDFIFHAAALKQVPSCEFYPMEAVKTNVMGTSNVIRAGADNGVSKIICLSTDKAAYPINAMGVSKAMMEKVALAEARRLGGNSQTVICVTRYGNVMGSRGSVIPLFIKQIMEDKPLTLTIPEMTRFLMSLNDAVDLVEFAFSNGKQGDLLIQKSPACTVETLSKALMQIFSKNLDIRVIGPRHGEKMFETLLTKEEFGKAQDLNGYFRVPLDARDLNYENHTSPNQKLDISQEYNSNNTQMLSIEEVVKVLMTLTYIPEISNFKLSKL